MTNGRKIPLGAKALMAWWIIVIVVGFFGNFWFAFTLLKANNLAGFLLLCAFGIGCGVMCYRTWLYWDEFRGGW